MIKKLIFTFLSVMAIYGIRAQIIEDPTFFVDLSLQRQVTPCGNIASDCANDIVCFDMIMSVDSGAQTMFDLDSYNVFVTYDNTVLTISNANVATAEEPCSHVSGSPTALEALGGYRVTGTRSGSFVFQANTPTVFHTVCFEILDLNAYVGQSIGIGGTPVPGINSTITMSDGASNGNAPAGMALVVDASNAPCLLEAPTITANDQTIDEDGMVDFCPVVADVNVGDVLTVSTCGDPVNGTATIDAMGCVNYVPNPNFNGEDSICVMVCDNGMPISCDSVTVNLSVTSINDSPVAIDDIAATDEDVDAVVDVAANDNDDADAAAGGLDLASVSIVTDPLNGTTSIDPVSGAITYTPNAEFSGVDSLEYAICDNGVPAPALCDTASVVFTVTSVNDGPEIVQNDITIDEDSTTIICPTVTDADMGDDLIVSSCGDPVSGTITVDPMTSCVTFVPNPEFNGEDSICIMVCDNGNPILCDSVTVGISVTSINDAPVAMDDAAATDEDVDAVVDVAANDNDDADVDGGLDLTSVSIVTDPLNGTTSIDAVTGAITYTPNAEFSGVDSLEYAICDNGVPAPALCDTASVVFTVTSVNDEPEIVQNDITIDEDSTTIICPTVTDDDMGDVLTVSSCGDPVSGTITVDPMTNCVTFVPNPEFNGEDSICIMVCDNGNPMLCDSITVGISVTSVNDAPVAVDDAISSDEDVDAVVDVAANDNDDADAAGGLDLTSVTIATAPLNGSTSIDPVSGAIAFTPNAGFSGLDSLEYSICDNGVPAPVLCDTASVVFTISSVNDEPEIVQNDITVDEDSTTVICPTVTDADMGDVLTVSSCGDPVSGTITVDPMTNCVTFVPNPEFNGEDSICIMVCDNGSPMLCDSVTVGISVTSINDAPVAMDDAAATDEDVDAVVDVAANDNDDADVDGGLDLTSVSIVTDPLNGTTSIDAVTGAITYTPNAEFSGVDSLEYAICDNGVPAPALCDTASVVFTVTSVNDEPEIVQNDITIDEDSTTIICPTVTDDDMGDVLTVSSCGDPVSGTITVDPMTNCVTFVPNPEFNGEDSICIMVCDNGSPMLCDSITVGISVTSVNDAPVAMDDVATTDEDVEVLVNVLLNDNDDADDLLGGLDNLTLNIVTAPSNGSVTVNTATGEIAYTGNLDFNGLDTFSYMICDNGIPAPVLCDTAEVFLEILPVQDCFDLNVQVFLEGPLNPITSLMSTLLNDYRVLPGQNNNLSSNLAAQFLGVPAPIGQPYNVAPYNHMGTEGDTYGDGVGLNPYDATVVDWVLLTVRENSLFPLGNIWQCAGLLHADGTVELPDSCPCLILDTTLVYYVAVEHRNHLPILSEALQPTSTSLSIDFRNTQSWTSGLTQIEARQKQIGSNFAMYSGNVGQAIGRTDINSSDNGLWLNTNGSIFLYNNADQNMDGDINSQDRSLWLDNNGNFNLIQF